MSNQKNYYPIGSIVRLRSGNTKMCVIEVDVFGSPKRHLCDWQTADGKLHRVHFDWTVLVECDDGSPVSTLTEGFVFSDEFNERIIEQPEKKDAAGLRGVAEDPICTNFEDVLDNRIVSEVASRLLAGWKADGSLARMAEDLASQIPQATYTIPKPTSPEPRLMEEGPVGVGAIPSDGYFRRVHEDDEFPEEMQREAKEVLGIDLAGVSMTSVMDRVKAASDHAEEVSDED